MDDIFDMIPPEVAMAIAAHGFDKVAAQVYGVEELNERTAAEIIGQDMFRRMYDWRNINAGLAALSDLY